MDGAGDQGQGSTPNQVDAQQFAALQQAAMYPQYANMLLGQMSNQMSSPQMANQQVLAAMAMNAAAAAAAAAATQPAGDEPLYVNAKQYHRILKRREARAKIEALNRGRREKGYIHESRHRHAMRRPRGPGGRFLSASELAALKEKEEEEIANAPSPPPIPERQSAGIAHQAGPPLQSIAAAGLLHQHSQQMLAPSTTTPNTAISLIGSQQSSLLQSGASGHGISAAAAAALQNLQPLTQQQLQQLTPQQQRLLVAQLQQAQQQAQLQSMVSHLQQQQMHQQQQQHMQQQLQHQQHSQNQLHSHSSQAPGVLGHGKGTSLNNHAK